MSESDSTNYSTFQSPWPSWLTTPITVSERSSPCTCRGMEKIYVRVRNWKCDLTMTWTRSGTGISGTETAVGTLEEEPLEVRGAEAPTTETEIESKNWLGWSLGSDVFRPGGAPAPPSLGQWLFGDGARSEDETFNGFAVVIGEEFEWTNPQPDRPNTWDEEELAAIGYVILKEPDTWYILEGEDSEPDDVGSGGGSFIVPIEWEKGKPGTPFFGTASATRSYTVSGIDYTVEMSLTLTPTEYWSHKGKWLTDTGEPVPPP